jgi:hypothetical protein
MKKIILVSAILLIILPNFKSQTNVGVSVPMVTYQIDTNSYSHGLQVPSGWYFSVNSLTAEIDSSQGFLLQSYTINSLDINRNTKVSNDSIPNMKVYQMSLEHVETLTLGEMVEEYVKKNLEEIYGVNNVIKLD